jgi:lysine-N-methylase
MKGIGYDASLPIDSMVPAYVEAYERYYQPFFANHPYIMENYLSNYIFRTQFPNGPAPEGERNNPTTAYHLMCLQYSVIKGALIGMAGHYREAFGAEHVVKLVQSFSKSAEHSQRFLRGINHELTGAAGMALLLKN